MLANMHSLMLMSEATYVFHKNFFAFIYTLTVFFCLFDDLLTFLTALGIGQHQTQSDRHKRPESPQRVMRRCWNELFSRKLLLVEDVLVLNGEVKAVTAGHRIPEGLPLQGQLTSTDVHYVHVLWTVDWICGQK